MQALEKINYFFISFFFFWGGGGGAEGVVTALSRIFHLLSRLKVGETWRTRGKNTWPDLLIITDLCFSSLESMVALKLTLFKCS